MGHTSSIEHIKNNESLICFLTITRYPEVNFFFRAPNNVNL